MTQFPKQKIHKPKKKYFLQFSHNHHQNKVLKEHNLFLYIQPFVDQEIARILKP